MFFFSILTFFAYLTENDISNRLNITKFIIRRSISVEIDTSLALFETFFLAAILIFFFRKCGRRNWRNLPTDLADLKYQTVEDNFLSCVKFGKKSDKNCDRKSAPTKKCKMPAMTSSISNFRNPRKTDLANICQIICRKFHQNPSIRLGCSAVTHTQTHTHIHKNTHIHTPSVSSQHIQSN